ncbi:hypothetical protein ACOMHN_052051 [Nucella lapillus]
MVWRELFIVFMAGTLFLSQCVTQAGAESEPTTECRPCSGGQAGQYVQCPGLQCPVYYQVTTDSADPSRRGAVQCNPPGTGSTPATTAPTPATTVLVETTSGSENSSLPAEFNSSTTSDSITTAPATLTLTSDVSQTDFPMSSEATASATNQPPPTTCEICLENCRICNGSKADDCLECRKDHDFDNETGRIRCVEKKGEDDKLLIIIIAASAGGGVFLLVVVVVVVVCCCCCRRRRRRQEIDREQGPGMLVMNDILPPSEQGDNWEPKKTEGVQRRPNKPGLIIPDYVNVTSTIPRPVSIERGHDKVTRYVRDPTVKMAAGGDEKPESDEDKELADLPPAPAPPPGFRKKSTDAGDHRRPPTRSHTTLPTDPTNNADNRRRGTSPSGAATLPASSDSQVPRFPIEEELEKRRRARAAPGSTEDGEDEDPEEDYVNVEMMAKLGPGVEGGQRSGGVHNPGLEVGEEPEDEYANESAFRDAQDEDQNPYQNLPFPGHR